MASQKPLHILHVDDSSILRKAILRGLEPFQEHYTLTQVESVDEALVLLEAGKKFDLILTDWMMNGKSGVDLLCLLKTDPAYHQLPVIFLTSEYENSSLVTVVTYGASGILKKPTTGPEIHAYLQKRWPALEQSLSNSGDTFFIEAKLLLEDVRNLLPLKNLDDLKAARKAVQSLKSKATTEKWPLLADYSQKIEAALESTLEKDIRLLTPMTLLCEGYVEFHSQALVELEQSKRHALVSEPADNDLKNYQIYLAAGWFEALPAQKKAA